MKEESCEQDQYRVSFRHAEAIERLAHHRDELERRLEAAPPRQPTALAKLWDRLAAYLTPEQLQAEKARYTEEFREQMHSSRQRSAEIERITRAWQQDVLSRKLDTGAAGDGPV